MLYLLHHALDKSAEKYPDNIALKFRDEQYSYQALYDKSVQLAHMLDQQGIKRRDRVGIFLNKGFETVIALYAIVRVGGVFVPLDPRSPVTRLESIIDDCGIRGIISDDSKAKELNAVASFDNTLEFVIGVTQAIDNIRCITWQDVAQLPADNPPVRLTMEDDLAYIMYTSGSTGKPKGMMHTHRSSLGYVKMSSALYDVKSSDVLSNYSPLHFDMCTFDYMTGIYCGAKTVIIGEAEMLFPTNLLNIMQDDQLTIWYSVPFPLIHMRDAVQDYDLSSLRWVMFGGEPFPPKHLRTLMEKLPHTRFSNVFGPAETNQSTYYFVPPPATWADDDAPLSVGQMVPNAQYLLLDEDDNEVADGDFGEWVVRTPDMMQGYWNRPELNAKTFYKREIFPDYTETYVRTGDLVRLNEQGLFDFAGRKDHMVKVRGFRVELADVENALVSHDAVDEAGAFVTRGNDADRLEAAVTLAPNMTAKSREIINHVKSILTHYAVPSKLHIIESFPRTGTDKIDRRALQAQYEKKNS